MSSALLLPPRLGLPELWLPRRRPLLAVVGRALGFMRGAASPYATWSPSDKHSSIVLSNGDLTATGGEASAHRMARSTIGKSSGKWYWEVTIGTGSANVMLGVANSSANLASFVGSSTDGWGYYQADGGKFNGSGSQVYGATYAAGNVIGIALDMDGGTITFYKNNTSQGQAFSGLSGTLYAAVSLFDTVDDVTANFGATALTYTPPAGYNSGLYTT